MNFYETLNVAPKATVEEIEQAYRQLARMAHPDFHQGQTEASEDRMNVLNLIRDTLTDPERRARYDAELVKSRAALRNGLPRSRYGPILDGDWRGPANDGHL